MYPAGYETEESCSLVAIGMVDLREARPSCCFYPLDLKNIYSDLLACKGHYLKNRKVVDINRPPQIVAFFVLRSPVANEEDGYIHIMTEDNLRSLILSKENLKYADEIVSLFLKTYNRAKQSWDIFENLVKTSLERRK